LTCNNQAEANTYFVNLNLPDTIVKADNIGKDSLKVSAKKSTNAIDSKVDYSAKDSIISDLEHKKVYLYGEAVIIYKDMELKAEYIELDLSKNEAFATSVTDSFGITIGRPSFKQGSEEFQSDTMNYNFKTKKGLIKGVKSKQEDGYLHSEITKKQANNVIDLQHGKYTTCDLEHPHFYIALSKAKVIPDDKIITGPAYLVIADIPLPLAVPFGFFPNKRGGVSGILIPAIADEKVRGIGLTNGGYFISMGDYANLSMRGSIYNKGSWNTAVVSTYKKRYKFDGNLQFNYSDLKLGEKGLDNYQNRKEYLIRWVHNEDSKAHPGRRFSAFVNYGSTQFNQYNSVNANEYLSNTTQSSISYSKNWANSPFSFTAGVTHSQNSRDSIVNMSLPNVSLNMGRINPLKRKNKIGESRWYEEIGISYSGNLKNSISQKENLIMQSTSNDFKNGISHSIPVSTSFKLFKYFTVNPSFNYNENWYLNTTKKYWDPNQMVITGVDTSYGGVAEDTINGFARVYNYQYSAALTTKLYGMYQFRKSKVKAIRHVVTPSVSFSYRPDFGNSKWGFYDKYQTDSLGNTATYSRFEDGIFGGAASGKYGSLNFNLGNNLEMKVREKNDTAETYKKVKLLESFNISSSYNVAADSMNWSNISLRGRTNLFNMIDIDFGGTINPYAVDSVGKLINKYEWDKSGRIGRITDATTSVGISLQSIKTAIAGAEKKKEPAKTTDGYANFNAPLNVRIDYSLRYFNDFNNSPSVTQTLRFSADLSLTSKWKIRINSGYDMETKDFTYTSLDIYRDLHCWEMSINMVPFGPRMSYAFKINVKSSILQDLKLEKKRPFIDNSF